MGYKRILIVEKEDPKVIALKDVARKLDVLSDIYEARNVDDTKDYISRHDDVELVLMGWKLPAELIDFSGDTENGKALLKFVKNCGIRVVVCSSDAKEDLKEDPEFANVPVVDTDSLETLEQKLRDVYEDTAG